MDEYRFTVIESPKNGVVKGSNLLSLTYTSDEDFVGEDSVVLEVSGGQPALREFQIKITVVSRVEVVGSPT